MSFAVKRSVLILPCHFQVEEARIGGGDGLFRATVGTLHDGFDAFQDVRIEVRVDLECRLKRARYHVAWNLQVQCRLIGEDLAERLHPLLSVGMNFDGLFDGVANVCTERRHPLLTLLDGSNGRKSEDTIGRVAGRNLQRLRTGSGERVPALVATSRRLPEVALSR